MGQLNTYSDNVSLASSPIQQEDNVSGDTEHFYLCLVFSGSWHILSVRLVDDAQQ